MKRHRLRAAAQIFRRHRRIDTIVQVGIGRGEEIRTLVALYPRAKWVGFEPLPDFVRHWRFDASYPGMVVPAAVWDSVGEVAIYRRHGNLRASSVYPRPDEALPPVVVPTVTLDGFDSERSAFGRNILLWLDAEGAEQAALRGAAGLFKSGRVRLVVSELANSERLGWPDREGTHRLLMEYGCHLVAIYGGGQNDADGVYVCQCQQGEMIDAD